MRTSAFKIIDDLVILVHNDGPPAKNEFEEFVSEFKQMASSQVKMLVFTEGGASTAAQRKKVHDLLEGRTVTTAVVSDALITRGIVTALSWFNIQTRSFPTSAAEDAFRYLGIPPTRFALIWREVKRLQVRVDGRAQGSVNW